MPVVDQYRLGDGRQEVIAYVLDGRRMPGRGGVGGVVGQVVGVDGPIGRMAVDEDMRPPLAVEAGEVIRLGCLLLHVVAIEIPSLARVTGARAGRRTDLPFQCLEIELTVLR